MTSPADLSAIVQMMKDQGVLHLKTGDVDITLAESALTKPEPVPEVTPIDHEKAREKIDEIKSLFQMSDSELLDKLFPVLPPASNEVI